MAEQVALRISAAVFVCFAIFFVIVLLADKGELLRNEKSRKRVKRGQLARDCKNGGSWNGKVKGCSCTFGWIGTSCSVWHDHFCYFDNGLNYRGKLSATKIGKPCLPWTTDGNKLFEIGKLGVGVHNYCRNPDNDPKGLWCYVEGDHFTAYCNATRCSDVAKDLLLMNASDVSPSDDTSPAVRFLFGPLIPGVCAGVVGLLSFIAVAEYARRKMFFAKKAKGKKKTNETAKWATASEKNSREVQPLGGIVTVDIDTGKKEVHTFNCQGLMKARDILYIEEGAANDAFLKEMNYGAYSDGCVEEREKNGTMEKSACSQCVTEENPSLPTQSCHHLPKPNMPKTDL